MSPNWPEIFGNEWEWVSRIGSSLRDPEEKRIFWETIREKKLADPSYSVYLDFPKEETHLPKSKSAELANTYGKAILADLAAKKKPEEK